MVGLVEPEFDVAPLPVPEEVVPVPELVPDPLAAPVTGAVPVPEFVPVFVVPLSSSSERAPKLARPDPPDPPLPMSLGEKLEAPPPPQADKKSMAATQATGRNTCTGKPKTEPFLLCYT